MHCYVKNFYQIFLHLRLATAWAAIFFAQIFPELRSLDLADQHRLDLPVKNSLGRGLTAQIRVGGRAEKVGFLHRRPPWVGLE